VIVIASNDGQCGMTSSLEWSVNTAIFNGILRFTERSLISSVVNINSTKLVATAGFSTKIVV
jgi:hypothetical protein